LNFKLVINTLFWADRHDFVDKW